MFHIHSRSFSHPIEYTIKKFDSNNITIFSDSTSCLTRLQNSHNPSNFASKNAHIRVKTLGKIISYTWIPGHCNIEENERADKASKLVSSSPDAFIINTFSYRDIKKVIEKSVRERMEQTIY